MAARRPEVTGSKISTSTPDELDGLAFTVAEFCAAHRLSIPFYYKLRQQGLGPAEIRLGTKVLISREAATAWRRAREAATAASV